MKLQPKDLRLPWYAERDTPGYPYVCDTSHRRVTEVVGYARGATQLALARHICLCVNHHDALLRLLRALANPTETEAAFRAALDEARALIPIIEKEAA